MRKPILCICRLQRRRSASQQLKLSISAFFDTWIEQFLYILNLKFPASNHLLCLYSSVCVIPGLKPQFLLVFSSSFAVSWTIRILHECQVWIDKSVPRVTFWYHEARRVMPNCDPRDRFVYPYLTRMMDSFSCTP